MANVISTAKKVAVISALVEGCSVRSTSRLTGVSKGAILRLLTSVGAACADYQDRVIRNISAKRVDEIWSFVGCKEKNVTVEKMEAGICGDVWTTIHNASKGILPGTQLAARDDSCTLPYQRARGQIKLTNAKKASYPA